MDNVNSIVNLITQKVNQRLAEDGNLFSASEAFLDIVYGSLEDVMDQNELIISSFDNQAHGIKLSGYDLVDLDNITIFLSDYDISGFSTISNEEINNYAKAMSNFILASKGDLYKKLDESSLVYRIAQYIHDSYNSIKKINLVIVTNKHIEGEIETDDVSIGNKKVEIKVFDFNALIELNTFDEEQTNNVFIDFKQNFRTGIKTIKCNIDNSINKNGDNFDVYLFFIKGSVLAALYATYGYRLLEGNVRSYLKKTQKTNRGILNTIEEKPNYFVSYNNGLSTVADSIEIEDGQIVKIDGWKIVNGGQTTATIFEAYKSGVELNDINVPVKLTVVNKSFNEELLVSDIARYANTQSKVNESDLSSNEKIFIELEKLSRSVSIPKGIKGTELEKWFFERIRGQYNLESSRSSSAAFRAEYPSKKKFDKKMLAKAIMSWEQEPYTVSLGGEKNFIAYNSRIRANEGTFILDEQYYKENVAALILFKNVETIVKKLKFGGYDSNIVTYVVAVLSLLSAKKLNLIQIWEAQGISDELKSIIEIIARKVNFLINDTPINNRNVAMYCRTVDCWNKVSSFRFDVVVPDYMLAEIEYNIATSSTNTNIGNKIVDISEISSNEWKKIYDWGKNTELLTSTESKAAYSMCKLIGNKKKPSMKQQDYAKSILRKAYSLGFTYMED